MSHTHESCHTYVSHVTRTSVKSYNETHHLGPITHCNTLQHTATHCNTLQHTTTHCNTLQHTATRCNTLQHIGIVQSHHESCHTCIIQVTYRVTSPRANQPIATLMRAATQQCKTHKSCHTYTHHVTYRVTSPRTNQPPPHWRAQQHGSVPPPPPHSHSL